MANPFDTAFNDNGEIASILKAIETMTGTPGAGMPTGPREASGNNPFSNLQPKPSPLPGLTQEEFDARFPQAGDINSGADAMQNPKAAKERLKSKFAPNDPRVLLAQGPGSAGKDAAGWDWNSDGMDPNSQLKDVENEMNYKNNRPPRASGDQKLDTNPDNNGGEWEKSWQDWHANPQKETNIFHGANELALHINPERWMRTILMPPSEEDKRNYPASTEVKQFLVDMLIGHGKSTPGKQKMAENDVATLPMNPGGNIANTGQNLQAPSYAAGQKSAPNVLPMGRGKVQEYYDRTKPRLKKV